MADGIIINGKIYTVNSRKEIVEALAIQNGRIVGTGTSQSILKKFRSKKVMDLQGKTVVPGFIDSHAHFFGLGLSLMELNLVGTKSPQEIMGKIREILCSAQDDRCHAERSEASQDDTLGSAPVWIRGRGWDQNDWSVKEFPTHQLLDDVSPNHPVYLTRIDGHAAWINKKAMEIAGIKQDTKDPAGGKIIRDKKGAPTGILIDNAINLVFDKIPPYSTDELRLAAQKVIRECHKYGLTSVQDMGSTLTEIGIIKNLIAEKRFPLRLYVAIDGSHEETLKHYLEKGPEIDFGHGKLTIRAVKFYIDGALGSRGAALTKPYKDDPSNRGILLMTEEQLFVLAQKVATRGFQTCTHAIGDRGNHLVLNVYEKLQRGDLRPRMEHAQVLDPDDIPRFKTVGILPSMQPTHCTSDMPWAEARIGARRLSGAYAWKSLLKAGVLIAAGSDFPVEHPNPLWGFYAAVTRQDHAGRPKGGWQKQEKMTREEALKAFTIWGATASFEEKLKGSIEIGKYADLVVLSQDIMKIKPQEILNTKVLTTVIDGEIVYEINS